MTNDELATFLGIATAKERDNIMASITPDQRALYERMAQVESELLLYEAGLGPKPEGVIICRGKR